MAKAALVSTYLEKRAMLVRYFAARTRNAQLAEDIVQEIYLKINMVGAEAVIENPTAFLFTTGTHIHLNQRRGSKRQDARDANWLDANATLVGDEPVEQSVDSERTLIGKQELAAVVSRLAQLPQRTQDIFRLSRFEGLNQQQVADQLSISKSSVEKHLATALRHILERLGP
jgi:RNA polymerase sigma factor (sigma-70 family)